MKYLAVIIFICFTSFGKAQTFYFPPISGNAWDTISPSTLAWCDDKIDTLLNYLDERNTKAFILLKDGKIVIEHYFDSFTMDSIWYWASAGKSLTACMVGIAQQENFLSINDTTSKYLGTGWTSAPPAKEDLITIRHQLTMTSGLDDGVADNSCTVDTCLQYLADAGTRWAYHNAPYTLLDSVIESATGQTLNSYVAQKLSTQTGITGAYIHSGNDNVFFSKPRSMARYGLFILNHGNWDGNQILTDSTYFHDMVNSSQNLNPSYGYLWWLNGKPSYMIPTLQISFPGSLNPSAPADMFAAFGKYGQIINIVPSMGLVYIRMGESPGSGGAVSVSFNDTIWQKLNDVFCSTSAMNEINNSALEELKCYPNPANEFINVDGLQEKYNFEIHDLSGRKIFSQSNNFGKTLIDCRQFQKGIYVVSAVSENKIFHQRILLK